MRPHRPLAMLTGLAFALALSPAARATATPEDELAYLRMTLPDEELVESATRAPKPLTQVAENVTVVTAEEIEAMNAHTLAEVLNRVTGVFVRPLTGGTVGDVSILGIQGSVDIRNNTAWHVTLLLDGVPWTQVGSGAVLVNTVPVGIIDRIEIVKGPASSTWGAALGGVVNVLTKKAGATSVPHGAAQGSYGERRTYDTRAEAAGAAGPVGYYLQAGAQGAEWESTDTDYWAKNLFGKVEVKAAPALTLGFTMAASHPDYSDEHSAPWSSDYDYPTGLALLSADARLSSDVTLHVAGFLERIGQDSEVNWDGTPVPDWGVAPPEGELALKSRARERNRGGGGHLVWAAASHTLTVGADYFKGRVKNSFENGPTLVDVFGFEPAGDSSTFTERWGLYVNDTARLGSLTITPGLRFDDTNLTEGFWSPSLGATLRLGASTLLRAQVARGFSTPPVDYLAGSATLLPNPDLDTEKVWSWQGGVETAAVPGVLLKVTAFRHEATDSLEEDPETGARVNWPQVWRQGLEAEAETASFAGLSATGGFAWAHIKKVGMDPGRQDQYQANLGLRYKRGTFVADLAGHFVWWDLGPGSEEGDHNDFLWDLAASKTLVQLGPLDLDLFGGVHNLFNGKQYTNEETPNPDRWVEGGARIRF